MQMLPSGDECRRAMQDDSFMLHVLKVIVLKMI